MINLMCMQKGKVGERMLNTKENRMTIKNNFKRVFKYKEQYYLNEFCERVVTRYNIAPPRVFKLVLGFINIDEITDYECAAFAWSFYYFNTEIYNLFQLIDGYEGEKITIKQKDLSGTEFEFKEIMEIQSGEHWIIKTDVKTIKQLLAENIIVKDNFVQDTLLEFGTRRAGYEQFINRRSINNISQMIEKSNYFPTPIILGTTKKEGIEFDKTNKKLTIKQNVLTILDGTHLVYAVEQVMDNLDYTLLVDIVLFDNEDEEKQVVLQMDHKNRLKKLRDQIRLISIDNAQNIIKELETREYNNKHVFKKEFAKLYYSQLLQTTFDKEVDVQKIVNILISYMGSLSHEEIISILSGRMFKTNYIIVRAVLYELSPEQVKYCIAQIPTALNKTKFDTHVVKKVCTNDVDNLIQEGKNYVE